jgi:hypothetical protein
MPWWNYFGNPLFWILLVFGFLLMLVIGTLFLAISLYAIEAKQVTFRDVLVTNLFGTVVDYVPILGIFSYWWIVVKRHGTGWLSAAAVWIIAWFVPAFMISTIFFLFLLPGFIPFWAL